MNKRNINKILLSLALMFSLFISGIFQSCTELKAINSDDKDKEKCVCVLSDDELVEVIYDVTSKWDHHYNMNVTIKNVSGTMIDDWEMYFDFNDKIQNIWNARIVENEAGENVVIHNADWNQDINIDESVTFGMTVRYDGEIEFPKECFLTREQSEVDEKNYVVEYSQNGKWDNHVNGSIKITNLGIERIEDWKLDFETSIVVNDIENIWNAKLIDIDDGIDEGSYCQVDNATYNQNIEPGQSIEFGFIAKCDGDIKIEESTLYSMVNVDYEDEDEDETIDLENPYWEPRYNLDDFDTYEEYEEYCNEIGYKPKFGSYARARTKTNSVEPFVKAEIVANVESGKKGKAIQSYLWDNEDQLLTLFRKPRNVEKNKMPNSKQKKANNSVFFSKAVKTKAGYYLTNQEKEASTQMFGFSHGQSFEKFSVGDCKKYMMGAGATDGKNGWSKSVAFIDSELLSESKKIVYGKKTKRITGFKYLVDHSLTKDPQVVRLDAALSSDGKYLVTWMQAKSCNQRIIALLDMSVIKNELYGKRNRNSYSLSSKKLREKALVLVANDSASKLHPNQSFQSIEVSDEYTSKDSKKRKWKIYITSGNEGKRQPLTLTRAVLTKEKDTAKITDFCSVNVKVPHNKQGEKILSETCELEGCHIKGEELQFLMTKSNLDKEEKNKEHKKDNEYKELKVVQYIVGLDKHFK